ncbi:MAG: hypothetical protein ACTSRW_12165 [Candidatus Helarchaeota archaeon]
MAGDIIRNFQADYILFDFIFLCIYVGFLVYKKKWWPLIFGGICGIMIYTIDAVIWTSTGIRTMAIPPLVPPFIPQPFNLIFSKFLVDFMMTLSYGMVSFSWMIIMFERKSNKEVISWTALVFLGWMLIPLFMYLVPVHDLIVYTNRHMTSIQWVEILIVIVSYVLLLVLKYDYKQVSYLFLVGCTLSFMMEFPLFIFGIRPFGLAGLFILVYDTFILYNQGVPVLWVFWDKVLPWTFRKIEDKFDVKLPSWFVRRDEEIVSDPENQA